MTVATSKTVPANQGQNTPAHKDNKSTANTGTPGSNASPGTSQKSGNQASADSVRKGQALQGEGNYEAAREFNSAERKFVDSGKVPEAARNAAPKSDSERREMANAEQEGKSHSKGEDGGVKNAPSGANAPGNKSRSPTH